LGRWRLIPTTDDGAVPGIHIWLRRWFTSMAILGAGVAILLVVPIRDFSTGRWASIFHLSYVNEDTRAGLLGEPLAWYLMFFVPALAWHLLDVGHITLRPVTCSGWDRLVYRALTFGLVLALSCVVAFRSELFTFAVDTSVVHSFDGDMLDEPGWLFGLFYAAFLLICASLLERLFRAIGHLARRLDWVPAA
jgi:hypothetical protein